MRLLAIDFSNLIFRHSANPYSNAVDGLGRSVAGPVGAGAQVIRLIREHSPTHLLIAQDGPRGESFRRELSPGYKSHRSELDEDLQRQFRLSYQMSDVLGWARCSHPGHEADDVIASAATQFPGDVIIVTGDKDLLALCSQTVSVVLLRPGASEKCGPAECERIFGVSPEQVQDYKALVGDTSDGITGVPGIGHKTAEKLLRRYGSIAGIYQEIDERGELEECSPSMTKKLIEGRSHAELSHTLAGMITEIELDHSSWGCPPPPRDSELGEALDQLGLTALRKSFPDGPKDPKPQPVSLRDAFNAAVGGAG